jgi:hypothetical protein
MHVCIFAFLPMYAVLHDAELTVYFCVLFYALCFVMTELPWLGMGFGIGPGLNLFYCVGFDCFLFHLAYSYSSSTLDGFRWDCIPLYIYRIVDYDYFSFYFSPCVPCTCMYICVTLPKRDMKWWLVYCTQCA